MFIDLYTIVMGLLFGLVLAVTIVGFLIYAAVTSPQYEDDYPYTARLDRWIPLSRHENQRNYLHVSGPDADHFDW
jgi:hypothetical protein